MDNELPQIIPPIIPIEPPPPPVKKSSKVISFLVVFLLLLITGVVVGGGVFYFQKAQSEKQLKEMKLSSDKQITELTNSVDQMTKKIASVELENAKMASEASQAVVVKKELERLSCKGVWKNGICVKSTCVDSDANEKPNDIYIKGTVTYTNGNGVENVVSDECTVSKLQVNEMWCYESPPGSGNFAPGKLVSNCPKGCLNGACIK